MSSTAGLPEEIAAAGLRLVVLAGAWSVSLLLGVSPHLLAIGRKAQP